ncbi:MAG: ATP-binding protein [Coleofasciculus sp. C2-GNP5-27]
MREYDDLPLIDCYPGELNQVFINILSNAIDALEVRMQQDTNFIPKIRICTDFITVPNQPDINKIIIRITDNGVGIDRQIKSRIFDPFFTTKTIGQGTGLGLSVAHTSIVERHKGEIHCKSLLGQGTEFVIELPV